MRYRRDHTTSKNHKKLLIIAVILLLLVGGGAAYAFQGSFFGDADGQVKDINQPPTDEEIGAGNVQKEKIVQDEQTDTEQNSESDSGNKDAVTPIITVIRQSSAGADLRVNSYVPGVVEDGGTCTLSLSNGGQIVSGSNKSFHDAQDTNCGQIIIDGGKLSPGDWQAVISYTSSSSEGKSKSESIEVK